MKQNVSFNWKMNVCNKYGMIVFLLRHFFSSSVHFYYVAMEIDANAMASIKMP